MRRNKKIVKAKKHLAGQSRAHNKERKMRIKLADQMNDYEVVLLNIFRTASWTCQEWGGLDNYTRALELLRIRDSAYRILGKHGRLPEHV